jgi:hypothetical protein
MTSILLKMVGSSRVEEEGTELERPLVGSYGDRRMLGDERNLSGAFVLHLRCAHPELVE